MGQLALIAWRLDERNWLHRQGGEVSIHAIDLRRLTGQELARHLHQIGAW